MKQRLQQKYTYNIFDDFSALRLPLSRFLPFSRHFCVAPPFENLSANETVPSTPQQTPLFPFLFLFYFTFRGMICGYSGRIDDCDSFTPACNVEIFGFLPTNATELPPESLKYSTPYA
jgi:hypothetical protein